MKQTTAIHVHITRKARCDLKIQCAKEELSQGEIIEKAISEYIYKHNQSSDAIFDIEEKQ